MIVHEVKLQLAKLLLYPDYVIPLRWQKNAIESHRLDTLTCKPFATFWRKLTLRDERSRLIPFLNLPFWLFQEL